MPLIFYILTLFLVLEFLGWCYSRLFAELNFLRLSTIIGITIHELSHYLACKLTLAPVKKFHLGRKIGYVIHGKSKIPIIGGIIITLAPLLVGLFFLGLIFYYLTSDRSFFPSLLVAGREHQWLDFLRYLKNWFSHLDYTSWQFWFGLFLSLNILATFIPSRQDYKNIFWAAFTYAGLSYWFSWFDQINLWLIYVLIIANILLIIATGCLLLLNLLKKFIPFL